MTVTTERQEKKIDNQNENKFKNSMSLPKLTSKLSALSDFESLNLPDRRHTINLLDSSSQVDIYIGK